jgi:hypothetical protein
MCYAYASKPTQACAPSPWAAVCRWEAAYMSRCALIHLPVSGSSSARRQRPDEFARVSGPGTARRGRCCLAEGGLGRCRISLAGALRPP